MISRPSQQVAIFQGIVSLANQGVSYLNCLQSGIGILASRHLFNRCVCVSHFLAFEKDERRTELSIPGFVRLLKTATRRPTCSITLRSMWACGCGEGGCGDIVRALSQLSAQRHYGLLSCLQCAVSEFTLGMLKGHGISGYLAVYPRLAVTRQIVPASGGCRMLQQWQKGVKTWLRGWKDSRKDVPRLTGRI